jgi:hypothetical protein
MKLDFLKQMKDQNIHRKKVTMFYDSQQIHLGFWQGKWSEMKKYGMKP